MLITNLVTNLARGKESELGLTGGSLLVSDVGRPDMLALTTDPPQRRLNTLAIEATNRGQTDAPCAMARGSVPVMEMPAAPPGSIHKVDKFGTLS